MFFDFHSVKMGVIPASIELATGGQKGRVCE